VTKFTPKKIAIVSEFLPHIYCGGGEIRYHQIAKRLALRGHEVSWLCMSTELIPEAIEGEQINYVFLGSKVAAPPVRTVGNFLTFIISLISHIRKSNYDLVDAQAFSPLMGAYLACIGKHTALIGTIHDVSTNSEDEFFQFRRLARAAEAVMYRLPLKNIVTVSQSTKTSLINTYGVPGKRVHVIHNGVDLAEVNNIGTKSKQWDLIYVGRLVPHKHIDHFIETCVRTGKTGAIIGHGPLEESIKCAVAHNPSIEFLGRLSSSSGVFAEIARSRALILPSTREGFGMVIAEASALGVPVIAYNCGGVSEVVSHNVSGILVPPLNIQALCNAVDFILSGSNAQRMGKAGRGIVEVRFTWEHTVISLEKAYMKALVSK